MFNISGKKTYKVTRVSGGISKRGQAYTIISVEDEPREYQKFGDKLTINIWGENISDKVEKDKMIAINGALDVGYQFKKGTDGKGYENLNINCTSQHIHVVEPQDESPESILAGLDDDLPF